MHLKTSEAIETWKHILAQQYVCPVAPGHVLKACCQINFQPLNLKVLLVVKFGLSHLFIVEPFLQLMEHQKTMLLSFCVAIKFTGCGQ